MHQIQLTVPQELSPVLDILETGGIYLEVSTDMRKFAARLAGAGRHVYPGFRPRYEPQNPGTYGALFDHKDDLLCCMAWRIFQTEDLVRDIENFLPIYCDHNETDPKWKTDLAGCLTLKGNIGYRGGLNSFNKGMHISWFMTLIGMVYLDHEGVDYQAGEARNEMVSSGYFREMSGYASANPLGSILIKKHGYEEALNLVWSSARQVREEITRRLDFLSGCNPKDFETTVAALKAQ
jgi:hypothetical protein